MLGKMTDWARTLGLIANEAEFKALHQARNEHHHGTMASAEERERIMQSAPTLVNLYLFYIKSFDDWRRRVRVGEAVTAGAT